MNVRLSFYHEDEDASLQEQTWRTRFFGVEDTSSSEALFLDKDARTSVRFRSIHSIADSEITAYSSIKYSGQEGEFDIHASDFESIDTPLGLLITTSLRFDPFADPFTLTFAIPPCSASTTLLAPAAVLIPRDQPLGCLVQRGLEHNLLILEPLERINAFVQLTAQG